MLAVLMAGLLALVPPARAQESGGESPQAPAQALPQQAGPGAGQDGGGAIPSAPDAPATGRAAIQAASQAGGEPWPPASLCPQEKLSPRDYNRCLFDATRTSEQELEVALANALVMIAARTELAAVQRNAWRNMLEEAQLRFRLFRNFDCQSVAPFEGPRGIGNFEQRALCQISTNRQRAQALYVRYGHPSQLAAPPDGPAPQLGTWLFATPPVVF